MPETVNAHFDGKVIVPDEPLDLPTNERLIVQIERAGDRAPGCQQSALGWLAANAADSEALPADLADQHDRYLYGRPPAPER